MILSDSPNIHSGLGRITRDIAMIASTLPQFRVATLGRGGQASVQLPFMQYHFEEELGGWGERDIRHCWTDFCRGDRGVLMTIWDLTRVRYLARPDGLPDRLTRFLKSKPFDLWGYIPVDHEGIGGRLTGLMTDTLTGFDRILAYSLFGQSVIETSLERPVEWMPHGFNSAVFQPRDRHGARMTLRGIFNEDKLNLEDGDVVVGCVMTNQARKDWGTAFGAIARLREKIPVKAWFHTDILDRYWSMRALIADFRLEGVVKISLSHQYSSTDLSWFYSACDVTMLPSLGEGHGFTNIESLACGVPCVNGNYAAVVENTPDQSWLVEPTSLRLDSPYNCLRPVYNPEDWARALERVIAQPDKAGVKETCLRAVEHLKYENLATQWKKWLLAGIGESL